MTFTACTEVLGITRWPSYFPALYDALAADGTLDATTYLEADYLRAADARYRLFDHLLPDLLVAANAIRADRALVRYLNLLAAALCDRERMRRHSMPALPPQRKGDIGRNFLAIFAMIPVLALTEAKMDAHRFEEEKRRPIYRSLEYSVDLHTARYGWPALDQRYFGWLRHHLDAEIITFGGFEFEMLTAVYRRAVVLRHRTTGTLACLMPGLMMHPDGMVLGSADYEDKSGAYLADLLETDAAVLGYPCDEMGFCRGEQVSYPLADWEVILRPGEPVVNVHIPKGTRLSGTAFPDACAEARAWFADHFPDFAPRAFVCFSWLMDRRLDALCGGAPGIANFQSNFAPFPMKDRGDEPLFFVFPHPVEDYAALPEDTRLMRAVKARYRAGKHLHNFGGVIPY